MSITYQILPDLHVVFVRFVGEVRPDEHIASFLDYAADPLFDGRQDVLLDLADCTLNESYFEEMQALAIGLKGYYEVRDRASRTAIWAPGEVTFGMCRMYQSLSDGIDSWPVGVFRTRDEALECLGFLPGDAATARLTAVWDEARLA